MRKTHRPKSTLRMVEQKPRRSLNPNQMPRPELLQQPHRGVVPRDQYVLAIIDRFARTPVEKRVRPPAGKRLLLEQEYRDSAAGQEHAGCQAAEAPSGNDNRLHVMRPESPARRSSFQERANQEYFRWWLSQ